MKQQFNVRLPQRTLTIIEQHKESDESYAEVIVRAVDSLEAQRTIEELRKRIQQLESLVKPAQ